MKIPDAISSKIDSEIQPVVEKINRLRVSLQAYEDAVRYAAERRVNNAVLTALGQTLPAEEMNSLEVAAKDLGDLLVDMTAVVNPAPKPVLSTVVAPTFADMMSSSQQRSLVIKKADVEDVEKAKRLISEIDELKKTISNQHPTRLFPLLQAIVAEVRDTINRLPEDHFFSDRLSKIIPVLGALKSEGGVSEFVKGLAFKSEGDWPSIASKSRRKVAEFDKDAATLPSDKRTDSKSIKLKPRTDGVNYSWPDLPNLRLLNSPILIAGGMIIPEKFDSIKERFGLDVEWHEIDHNNPRAVDTLLTRVKGGKVGAVICIEGFMKHGTFKPLVEVCSNANVPLVMGGKGGIAAFGTAFDELEKKLRK